MQIRPQESGESMLLILDIVHQSKLKLLILGGGGVGVGIKCQVHFATRVQ